MKLEDYVRYDAIGLAGLVRKRQVSPRELVGTALEGVARVNPQVNCMSQNYAEAALAAAESFIPDRPLAGVPFLIKDIGIAMAGTRIRGGSRLLVDSPPAQHDSELMARYRRAGLIVFGRTTTPEFGASATTETELTGATRNPWNLGHSAGGSSGGSAAAVAAGIVPAAQGGDGGGSLRIPGACCHLFALKPTRQRLPTGPDGGDQFFGMSVAGVLTRSVRDSALLMDVSCGPDAGAPYWAPPPERPYMEEIERPAGKLRIALATQSFAQEPVDPQCRAAARDAAKLLEDLGHTVVEDQPDYDRDEFFHSIRALLLGGIEFGIGQAAAALGKSPSPENLQAFTLRLYEESRGRSASDFIRAAQYQGMLGRKVGAFFEKYDVLLTPSLATPPVPIGYLKRQTDDFDTYMARAAAYAPFQPLFNSTGQPAANVPFAVGEGNLPIGIQIATRFGDEATIFRLAAQIEMARPWQSRLPGVHVTNAG